MDRALNDRRPACRINFNKGVFSPENPQGVANFWLFSRDDEDAVNELCTMITAILVHYDIIDFNRWTGECDNQGAIISTDPWLSFTAGRKAAIIAILIPFLAACRAEKPTRRFNLYIGFKIRNDYDATKLCTGGLANVHAPDLDNPLDEAYQRAQWEPLLEIFDGVIIDDSAGEQTSIEQMYDRWGSDFFTVPIEVTAEAIARLTASNYPVEDRYMPDASRIERQPFYAFNRFVITNEASASELQGEEVEWTVDATVTNISVCWTGNAQDVPTRGEVVRRARGGFRLRSATTEVDPWIIGISRTPVPENVVVSNGVGGNTITWDITPVLDDLGVPIAVSFYEVFRSRDGGDYTRIATPTGLSYLDATGLAGDLYEIGSWTEYNCTSHLGDGTRTAPEGGFNPITEIPHGGDGGDDDDEDDELPVVTDPEDRRYIVPTRDSQVWRTTSQDE